MDVETKRRIIEYVRHQDPAGKLVQAVHPTADFVGGTILYNSKSVRLHRAISVLTDEEYVRAYLLVRLVVELGYPAGPDTIEFEREYSIGRRLPDRQKARADLILRYPSDFEVESKRGSALLFVECKTPDSFELDRKYIEGQVFDLSKQEVVRPEYGVYYTIGLSNGEVLDRTIIVSFEEYSDFAGWDAAGQPSRDVLPVRYGRPSRITYADVQEADQNHRPLRTNVTPIEFERLRGDIHDIVWSGGGANNNDVFVTLLRLVLCRIYDELETVQGEPYRFQRQQRGDGGLETAEELVNRMSTLFLEAAGSYLGYSEEELQETVPFERRKVEPGRVAYVVEQLQGISLTRNTAREGGDLLGDFFERIVAQDFTQSKGQFFTHHNLVEFCLALGDVGGRIRESFRNRPDEQGRPTLPYIIDPSAGSGTFVVGAMQAGTAALAPLLSDGRLSQRQRQFAAVSFGSASPNQWAREYVYGVEPNADLGLACKVNMILHGDGSTNIFVKSGLLPFDRYAIEGRNHVLGAARNPSSGAYKKPLNERFDIVLTNPPFSLSLNEAEQKSLEPIFELSVASSSETIFIERWYQLLAEGGIAISVLPESIFDTTSSLSDRLFIMQRFHIEAVVSLPYVAFKPFTSTKTCIVYLRKRDHEDSLRWKATFDAHLRRHSKENKGATAAEAARHAYEQTIRELEPERRVFMAEPEHVGYKRRKGLADLATVNDLVSADDRDSVLSSYRSGPSEGGDARYGFWVSLGDIARSVSLRCDPKYHSLWTLNQGRVFAEYSGQTTRLGTLISPSQRDKVKKGPLGTDRELIELEDVEARTSKLLGVQTTDVAGSDKIEFGDAAVAISKLEPYLGKVLTRDAMLGRIGSTEWLTYDVMPGVDVDYIRYLLVHPSMLDAYRCLQSGKRHARFSEVDFLNLEIPDVGQAERNVIANTARHYQSRIDRFAQLSSSSRAAISRAYSARFEHPETE